MNESMETQTFYPTGFLVKTGIVLILWAAAFIPVYPDLWQVWMKDSNNSHGVLVPLISGFIIWTKMSEVAETPPSGSNWGAVILFGSLIIYILAIAGHVTVAQRAMIVVSLIGLVIFIFGTHVFYILVFPLLYLFFMIPVPDTIYGMVAFPLQLFASDVSRILIQAVNIPVLQEGNMLYFAQTQLEVAEACSGLRSMMTFVMLGALFAYLMDEGRWRRVVLVLSAIPLAIVANIIRVAGTGILAHFYGEQVAQGFMHDFSGMAVFAFGFVVMLGEYLLLNKIGSKKE